MKKIKNQLQHEILNLLTMVQLSIESGPLSGKQKIKISHWIRLAAILIRYEPVFLGEKIPITKSAFSLKETIASELSVYKRKGCKNKFRILIPERECVVKADAYLIREAFDFLMDFILPPSSLIDFEFTSKQCDLVLHSSKNFPKITQNKPALSLKRENLGNNEIPLQIALELFKQNGVRMKFSQKTLQFSFPS